MPKRSRGLAISVASAAVTAALGVFVGLTPGTPASAASAAGSVCYLSPAAKVCDNRDPKDTGCWDSSAYVASHAELLTADNRSVGTMQNWYSPHCGTNWARFVPNGNTPTDGTALMTVSVCLGVNTSNHCSDQYSVYRTRSTQPPWSNMIYAKTTPAQAYFVVSDNYQGWGLEDSVVA
jgi:hypothetical protein